MRQRLKQKNQDKTDRRHLPTDYAEIKVNKQMLYSCFLGLRE